MLPARIVEYVNVLEERQFALSAGVPQGCLPDQFGLYGLEKGLDNRIVVAISPAVLIADCFNVEIWGGAERKAGGFYFKFDPGFGCHRTGIFLFDWQVRTSSRQIWL